MLSKWYRWQNCQICWQHLPSHLISELPWHSPTMNLHIDNGQDRRSFRRMKYGVSGQEFKHTEIWDAAEERHWTGIDPREWLNRTWDPTRPWELPFRMPRAAWHCNRSVSGRSVTDSVGCRAPGRSGSPLPNCAGCRPRRPAMALWMGARLRITERLCQLQNTRWDDSIKICGRRQIRLRLSLVSFLFFLYGLRPFIDNIWGRR